MTYLSPFRIIDADHLPPWSVTIEQINDQSWDYATLHEIVGAIDVGLRQPYNVVITRDGGLALPPLCDLNVDHAAVQFFNRCLAGLLIGGVYCEAISADGLDTGFALDWKYVRSRKAGQAASNRFHEQIRYARASPLEAIRLLDPRNVRLSNLETAMRTGLGVLDRVTKLRGDLLLKGVTGVARRDWEAGLSNLWIVIEQIVSHIWDFEIIQKVEANAGVPSKLRRNQLSDNRTWTAAAKLEMLCQKGILSVASLAQISAARKARNDLAHEGHTPSEASAWAALGGIRSLLAAIMPGQKIPLFDLDLSDHVLSDPLLPPSQIGGEPKYWLQIPKLPGEAELEKLEFSEPYQLRSDERN
ncbi:MAG: hypothetical protein NT113_10795 [Hyphomicrobiales bacterium]|nr:hypothetical protein [Hyphomicrobiales bacterium]